MIIRIIFFSLCVAFFSFNTFSRSVDEIWDTPNWGRDAELSLGETRENIYELSDADKKQYTKNGKLHALVYPVEVSGIFLPTAPMKKFLKDPKAMIDHLEGQLIDLPFRAPSFKTMDGFYDWVGLYDYPDQGTQGEGFEEIPYPSRSKPSYRMGVTLIEDKEGNEKLTFSCATCHSMEMFGKKVLGLTNKRPRANEVFVMAGKYLPYVHPSIFRLLTGANDVDTKEFTRTRKNVRAVGTKTPLALGLDTSLAQMGLSFSKRHIDGYIEKSPFYEKYPRYNELSKVPADSKPAVWWNVKYKTRWLSDGSIVSGNPIFTNFLWNEIGRGVDLHKLEKWMDKNKKTVIELTSAVFSNKAPHFTDFFEAELINIEKAKKGELVFNNTCKKCHGQYVKNWSNENAHELSSSELLKTKTVLYHEKTPVKKVGTDPLRYEGMKYFYEDLNKLTLSKKMNTVVEPQEGYVPPPLVGIWMRYPYFHNGSAPTLCDVVTRPSQREKVFYQGPADNPKTDFDFECVGYPRGKSIPKSWRTAEAKIDTSRPGLRNTGHYKMWLDDEGSEKYSWQDKINLIEFLKTL